MGIGPRLRALRSQRGLTLADLAGNTLSVGLVSKIERDLVNPSLQTLDYLAERLDIPAGALLDVGTGAALTSGALAAARARLLLGDPAAAAAEALGAARVSDGGAAMARPTHVHLRARLLAVAAEGALGAGNAGQAAMHVRDASALLGAPQPAHGAAPDGAAQLELMWVLGALERRRGALADAERTWTGCLGALEQPPDAGPWWLYLRALVLAELGGLAESRADSELARNLVARAASIASGVAQAVGPATALLAEWSRRAALADGPVVTVPHANDVPSGPAAALALAVIAAAERLSRRLALEAARLERTAWSPSPAAPDVPTTRGLR